MGPRLILFLALIACLIGCGSSLSTGTYTAVAEASGKAERQDKGYSLEDIKGFLVKEPRTIQLDVGNKFRTLAGSKVNWEGSWRVEGGNLILKTEKTDGNVLGPALQVDTPYKLEDGAIVDEDTYKPYGIRLVYRRN